MGTAEQTLDVARGFLHRPTREEPDGSNRVAGITDQGGFVPAAWCDAFVQTCLRAAGVDSGPQTMWVSNTIGYFRGLGRAFTNPRDAQPGDLVAFEWGTTSGGYDHIGFVESVRGDGLVTIEGNIGNRVQNLFRSWTSGIAELARPDYAAATAPPAPTPPSVPTQVWRRGSRGEYVKQIQTLVQGQILAPVTVDGVYGELTEAAVKVWQSKLGVTPDGVWGPATQAATDALLAYLASLPQAPPPPAMPTLRLGARGDAVVTLQRRLLANGVPVGGGIDGVFGYGTNHAVVWFQRTRGLVADGVVGPRTWAALG